jgi:hypothetical protein
MLNKKLDEQRRIVAYLDGLPPFAPLQGSATGEGQCVAGVAGQGRGGVVRVDAVRAG